MEDHFTEVMIDADGPDFPAQAAAGRDQLAVTDEDVQGYSIFFGLVSSIVGQIGNILPPPTLSPTHTATAVESGGSSGGSLEVPTSLN